MRTGIVAGMALLALVAPAAANSAVIHVDCGHANLQAKIQHATAGSTLEIEGTCVGTFTVAKSLTLRGAPKATLDAADGGRPLKVSGNPRVLLTHLVVTGGHVTGASAEGGGILHIGGSLTLRHVTVAGNDASAAGTPADSATAAGAGIYSNAGSLRLVASVIRGNQAQAESGFASAVGGGVYRTGDLAVDGTSIVANKAIADSTASGGAASAGGLLIEVGAPTMTASHVGGNRAHVNAAGGASNVVGGGLYLSSARVVHIARSSVNDNRATGSTSGSSADTSGGGVGGELSGGTLVRTTVAGNLATAAADGDATTKGGGLGLGFVASSLVLSSVRIAGNSAHATGTGGVSSVSGGGLDLGNGMLRLKEASLNKNTASSAETNSDAQGGGLRVAGELHAVASALTRNVASAGSALGGGIYLPTATTTASIKNSTIAKNRLNGNSARGGGIDTFVDLGLTGSTVAANGAAIGGGIYREQGTVTLAATIVGSNSATASPQCSGPIESNGHNLIASTKQCTFMQKPSDLVRSPK